MFVGVDIEGKVNIEIFELVGEENKDEDEEDEDDEEVVVCGYFGNVIRIERGIKYLGKWLVRYILFMIYLDQFCFLIVKVVLEVIVVIFKVSFQKKNGGEEVYKYSIIYYVLFLSN